MSTVPAGQIRDVVVARLVDGVSDLEPRIIAKIRGEVAAYAHLDPTQLDEVRRIVGWGVRRVLETWLAGSGLTENDLRLLRGIGAARALDGRPLTHVLSAYRVAGRVLTDTVLADAGPDLTAPDVLELARVWMQTMDEITEALVRGHEETRSRIDGNSEEAVTTLLRDLLLGHNTGASAVRARAERAAITVPALVGMLVGTHVMHGEAELRRAVERDPVLRTPDEPGAPLRSVLVHDGCTVVVDAAITDVAAAVGWLDRLPAPRPPGGTGALRNARTPPRWFFVRCSPMAMAGHLALARLALPVLPPHAWDERTAITLGDAQAAALATASHLASSEQLVQATLAPLESEPALLSTVRSYLATGNANEAARAEGCHPQSVRHRLARIAALTGYDPRRAWDRHVLQTALMARDHLGR